MATYFCNCGSNIANFDLCVKYNVAGFPSTGYNTGDLVYLIVKENGVWKLGAKGILKEPTAEKPWDDADDYKSAYNINWEIINRIEIVETLRKIYPPNYGLAIQGKKNLDTFQNKGPELKKSFNSYFTETKAIQTSANQKTMKMQYSEILSAIKTKPFILLAGISGTGKSRLVRTLAFKSCPEILRDKENKKPGNYEIIPVRPNWHDSTELMGYVSRINGEKYIKTSFLQFIAKAWNHINTPFFLCLDEMNLAPVEQYFAEYLSIIETRQVKKKKIVSDYLIARSSFENEHLYDTLLEDLFLSKVEFSEGIGIPKNLIVMGTVNMDETTHSFSRKVLDRAMTFEMNEVDLSAGLDVEQNDWSYPHEILNANQVLGEFTSGAEVYNESFNEREDVITFLQKLNQVLEGTPFKIAYRVRDEFLIYCYHAGRNHSTVNWLTNALDEMTNMKVLSRIEGDENKTQHVLTNLLSIITNDFKKSHTKLLEMQNRLQSNGYTSFWT